MQEVQVFKKGYIITRRRSQLPNEHHHSSVPDKIFKASNAASVSTAFSSSGSFDSSKRDSGNSDSGNFPIQTIGGRVAYTALMFAIYGEVVQVCVPHFMGPCIPVTTNLNLAAWEKLAIMLEQHRVMEFMRFGFPASYEGAVPSPTTENHASARSHPRDIAVYITTELRHGTMLSPLDNTPSTPLCQRNPLLTNPNKGSNNR